LRRFAAFAPIDDACGEENAAPFGPRQGDVEEPQILGERLASGERPVTVERRRAEIAHHPASVVVAERHLILVIAADELERAEDDRVLQPFADVRGDDLDRWFVAFEANLVLLAAVSRRHALAEPRREALHAEAARVLLAVQQLEAVQHIGQRPLARRSRRGQQPLAHPFAAHQLAGHHHEATLPPEAVVVTELLQPLDQSIFVAVETGDVAAVQPENRRDERGANERFASRIGERRHENPHLLGLNGGEHALVAAHHRHDARLAQRRLHQPGLLVGAHDHRNAARIRTAADRFGHHRGARLRRELRGVAALQAAVPLAAVEQAEFERRLAGQLRFGDEAASNEWRRRDAVKDKWLAGVVEETVEAVEQLRRRAPVRVEREAPLFANIAGGLEIGEDVRPAKAVDRLLGIADEEKWRIRVGVDAPEDVVLHRIGVLKLVDQRRLVAISQCPGQRVSLRAIGESVVKIGEQVVEKADISLFFALRQPLAVERDQLGLQRQQPLIRRRLQLLAGLEKRMRGRGAVFFDACRDA